MNELDYIPQGSIYKYTSVEAAVATLQNTSFKFSCPLDFNDPFDCNISILEFSKTRSSIQEAKKALDLTVARRNVKREWIREFNNPGNFQRVYRHIAKEKIEKSKVTCFSKRYDNTLMWSHYANQHKGVCLEFNGSMHPSEILERGKATILNVNYDRKEIINYNKNKEQAIVDLFTRKSSDWKYEEEVRIIVMDDSQFHKFNKSFFTGLIFGCRIVDEEKQKVLDILKEKGYNIPVKRALRGKYKLEFRDLLL
jgi:hypothetical protein